MADGYWKEIEGALNAQLVSMLPNDQIVFENQGGTDSGVDNADGTFVEAFFLPAEPRIIEVADNGRNRNIGVYQATINIPAGDGKSAAYTRASLVTEGFKRGTILMNGGVNVRCVNAYLSSGFQTGSHYQVPVTVNWLADVAN